MISTSRQYDEAKIRFIEYDLKNGLHIILHRNNSSPIICVNIWYHVGSKNEDKQRTGFAHLFEHMMFQGSRNVGKAEHFNYIQKAGGMLNGSTSQDITNYFEVLPSNCLELALWLESDRMAWLNVTQDNFDNQREVVKEEKRQHYDNAPYGGMPANLFSKAYIDHPYSWIPIGSMEDLNNAPLSYAKEFYQKFYSPSNAVLSISGDIEINPTEQLIEKYFADLATSKYRKNGYQLNKLHTGEKTSTEYDNVHLPALYTAYKIPELTSQDIYPLKLLSLILSNGRSSRLYRNLVYDKKISKSVYTYLWSLELGGLFLVSSMGLKHSKLDIMKEMIDSELNEITSSGVLEPELQKAKNIIEINLSRRNETNLGISDRLAFYWTFYKDTKMINSDINKYLSVTQDDIIDSARKYLTPDNRVTLYYLPKNSID